MNSFDFIPSIIILDDDEEEKIGEGGPLSPCNSNLGMVAAIVFIVLFFIIILWSVL